MVYVSKAGGETYVMPSTIYQKKGVGSKYDSGRVLVMGDGGNLENAGNGITKVSQNKNVLLCFTTSKGYSTTLITTDRGDLLDSRFMQSERDWHNTEFTVKFMYKGGNDLGNIILGLRTGLGELDPCQGFSYKAGLELTGTKGFFSKQQYYKAGNDYRAFNTTKLGSMIKNKFITLKLIVYDLDHNGKPTITVEDAESVKLEVYGSLDSETVASITPSPGSGLPLTYSYDDFPATYNLTTLGSTSPNGLWEAVFVGTNPTDGTDHGQQGVRVPAAPTGGFPRVYYAYPYQNDNTSPSSNPGYQTAAPLALTTVPYFEDFDVTFYMRTIQQLRSPATPNAWETAWFMWHYNEAEGSIFHHYYIALKSNHTIEFGRKDNPDGAEHQYYLPTITNSISWGLGQWNKVRIKTVLNHIEVWIDDVKKVDCIDDGTQGSPGTESNPWGGPPYPPSTFMYSGRMGPYSEDSELEISPLLITDLSNPPAIPPPPPLTTPTTIVNKPILLKETIDNGRWGEADACGGDAGIIGLWGGPVATLEWRDGADIDIQSISIREIDPTKGFEDVFQVGSLSFTPLAAVVEQSAENVLAAAVTEPTGKVNDSLGVQQIYKTKPGGSVWVSKKDGLLSDKQFSDNNYSIKSNGDGTYAVDNDSRIQSFSTKAQADRGPDFDGYSTHDYEELRKRGAWDSTETDWRDVEMTGYVKMKASGSGGSGDEISFVVRSVRHNNASHSGCGGSSYHGNIHVSGHGRFKKEQWHVKYQNDSLLDKGVGSVKGKTIGWKFVCYNINDNKAVKMELYIDKDNNNTWEFMGEKIDAGDWTTSGTPDMKHCGATSNLAIISWGSPKVIWKWNLPLKVDISKMSVREIIPEKEDGTTPTTPPPGGSGGGDPPTTGGTGQLSRIQSTYEGVYDVIVNSSGQTCAGAPPASGVGVYTELTTLTVTTITDDRILSNNNPADLDRNYLGWFVGNDSSKLKGIKPTQFAVYARKQGLPTGMLTGQIRDENNNIIVSFGGIDVTTIGTTFDLVYFTNDNTPAIIPTGMQKYWKLSVTFDGGDATNNIVIGLNFNNPVDGTNTYEFQHQKEPGPGYSNIKYSSRDMAGKIFTSP